MGKTSFFFTKVSHDLNIKQSYYKEREKNGEVSKVARQMCLVPSIYVTYKG